MGTAQGQAAVRVREQAQPQLEVSLATMLVATDFSPCSESALRFASALARQQGAKIFLFHVLRFEPGYPKPMQAAPPELSGNENEARLRLDEALSAPELRDIQHDAIIGRGELWPVLQGTIKQYEVELVVVGTHGRDGLKKLLLGSAAEQVFRHSPCPVLTVGPQVDAQCLGDGGFRRVLYATDFSPSSLHALAYAALLARQNLTLLHVLCSDLSAGEYGTTTFDEKKVVEARQQLRGLIPAGVEADAVVEVGLPAGTILRVAREQNASLIVMGVNASSAFAATHLPWATAHRVIRHAHCPVLTVR
jgi:nucleotide-binding universal stress UspA family protein